MTGNSQPRVLFVAAHDSLGGAARAVHRIYDTIRRGFDDRVNIHHRVIHKTYDDEGIIGGKPTRSKREYAEYFLRTRFRKYFPRKPFVSDNTVLHSQALYHSGLGREINALAPDVIMLGWLGNATLSIPEIGSLKAPVVWRLSDMWMFSGAEHYTAHARYESGYSRSSRPDSESGPDIDRETFLRKKRHWRSPRHVICPSNWMADQVRRSTLTAGWPVHVIPNPIDSDKWAPESPAKARRFLGLPQKEIVVLFGAGGGTKYPHKGADLFFESLPKLRAQLDQSGDTRPLRAAVFGEEGPERVEGGVPVTFLGRLDDEGLKNAYSAADIMVVPSRLDNLPSTAVEAQSCATPVVAFRIGGLPDIVDDGVTGKLAEPFDTGALAEAMHFVVSEATRQKKMGDAARERAKTLWAPETIAAQYLDVLEAAMGQTRR